MDAAAMEALRDVVATRTRERRTVKYGWEDDGTLSLTVVIGNVSSPVIGVPSAIVRYVAGRHFSAVTQDESPVGTVVVDEKGTSWGYGPFLRRRGAETGDVLTIRFDLTSDHAVLTLTDSGDLDD